MTRRDWLLASTSATLLRAADESSRLSMEAYIFQQYAQRRHEPLGDVLTDVIPMAREAGFRNIELNAEFFAPACRDKTLALIGANRLRMPSVYSGGALHDREQARHTAEAALAIAQTCKSFGCRAVVCNANPKGEGIEKTDAELATQAEEMNRMGRELLRNGFELRIHNHTPEMLSNAREWRYTLQHTDAKLVTLCLDLDWVHQGDQQPLALLKEAGKRVTEIHIRNSRNKLWLEDVGPGDVDYPEIARYLDGAKIQPLVVVELAYRSETAITRTLAEDLRFSRLYAEKVFGISA